MRQSIYTCSGSAPVRGFLGRVSGTAGAEMILFSKVDVPPLSGATENNAIGTFLDEYTVETSPNYLATSVMRQPKTIPR
jgi:hypothetical protein